MVINTKDFQVVANKILSAVGVDKNAGNLELKINGDFLYLSVTNKEFYVSVKFAAANPEPFSVVVDAALFLNLISGITAEEFTLNVNSNVVTVMVGKSKYELPIIMDGALPMALPVIQVNNIDVEMPITNDILTSILNVNSKEVAKNKGTSDANELRKLYFINETGCYTFAMGSACLNAFTLEKPMKLLLNDRIVKLFKLFTSDVDFKMGHDALGSNIQTKISMQADNIYLAAKVTNSDLLVTRLEKLCTTAKSLAEDNYINSVVINNSEVSSAISRLMNFNKNVATGVDTTMMPATFTLDGDQLTIADLNNNIEYITIENDRPVETPYSFAVNMVEVKAILDSSKTSHSNLNCGNKKSIILVRGTISNVLCELQVQE